MRKLDKEKIVVIMEKDPKEFEKAVNAAMEEKKLDSPTLEMHIFECEYFYKQMANGGICERKEVIKR